MSVSGAVGLVGAFRAGVNNSAGAAYLFRDLEEVTGIVHQDVKLVASDGLPNYEFGYSVALSGDIALIGSVSDRVNAVASSGSAYVFRNLQSAHGTITQDVKLIASDGSAGARFGGAVDLSGSIGLVGAKSAAYLFHDLDRVTGVVTQNAKLCSSVGDSFGGFGYAVSISGTIGLVGAPNESGNEGCVYVFRDLDVASGSKVESARLLASDDSGQGHLGRSVSLSGSLGLAGSPSDSVTESYQGSAYLFSGLDTATGTEYEILKLWRSAGGFYHLFGDAVSLDGDGFVIGAHMFSVAPEGPGVAFSGNVSSFTSLDAGDVSRDSGGLSFRSRVDWVIGVTADSNRVTLSEGDSGEVNHPGMSVFIGRERGADYNSLTVEGTLMAGTIVIGSVEGNEGNVLRVADTANLEVSTINLTPENHFALEGAYASVEEFLQKWPEVSVNVWRNGSWMPASSGTAVLGMVDGYTYLSVLTVTPTPTATPSPIATPVPPPRPRPKPRRDVRPPHVHIEGSSWRTTRYDFAILNGRVTDNRRVKEVEIRSGGNIFKRRIKGTSLWYQLVDLVPGRNVFRVRAEDSAGNRSKPKRVTIVRDGS